MKLKDIIDKLDLEVRGKYKSLDKEVTGGYISDLLSDVLANGKEGDIWITLQIHPNVVAVASVKGISGIVMINGREPEAVAVTKAEEENIPIMVTRLTGFDLIGKLCSMGVPGKRNNADGI